MNDLINFGKKIFPICRSITGNGTLKPLNEIKKNSRVVLDEVFNKEKIIKMIVNKSFS